jgi:hypothetical protein
MYEAELSKISTARNELYELDTPVIVLIALVVLSIVFLPMLSPVFGLASFIYLYLKLVKVARMPCPQCAIAFGTSSLVVLGPGADRCENCGLSLN